MKLKRSWTPDDDAKLRQLGQQISLQRLAVRLERSVAAVIDRARVIDVEVNRPRLRRKASEAVVARD